jgi:hypothetical protein
VNRLTAWAKTVIVGDRRHLTDEQLNGTRCAKCGAEFTASDTPQRYRVGLRRLAICDYACILNAVEAVEALFAAKVPDAMLWLLGLNDDPDPVWFARQQRAEVTVHDGATTVETDLLPLPYAEMIAAQARDLGMAAEIGPVIDLVPADSWAILASRVGYEGLDVAYGAADAAVVDRFGTYLFTEIGQEGRELWHRVAWETAAMQSGGAR